MLSLSAKTVALSARPSRLVSSRILMTSLPWPAGCGLFGIVLRLGDPQPAALVPRHRLRVAGDQRLGREQLQLEAGRNLHVLRGFVRRERLSEASARDSAARSSGPAPGASVYCSGCDRERGELGRDVGADRPGRSRSSSACGSSDGPTLARRGRTRCRRRGPCRACGPTSTARGPRLRRAPSGRCGRGLCFVWT